MTEAIKYIKKVEIQGLFGRYDIEWNLHPDVNVLAGINGSGKTTILNGIYSLLAFSRTFPECRETVAGAYRIVDYDIKTILNNNISLEFVNNGFKSETGLGSTQLLLNLIHTFDSEARTSEYIRKTDSRAKTELDFDLSELQKAYTKYQVRIYKYDSEMNRATHKRFLAMLDELFAETNKRVNPDKEELEFLLSDKEISVYQLSSGEKQLLVILLTVLVQDNKPAILLMDEPEISLHFEWQENLINYIRELNPNAQLIIATHSADIIMKGWGDRVFELSELTMKDRLAS